MQNINKLHLIFGNQTLGIQNANFNYIFNYSKGGIESLKINNKEWIYRIPQPTFWRATTDNDRGNKFSQTSAMWLGADMFTSCVACRVKIDEEDIEVPTIPLNKYPQHQLANRVILKYTFQTATLPITNVDITYIVNYTGDIVIEFSYHGQDGLPELPALGLRIVMPTLSTRYNYKGLGGETYPDRMQAAAKGNYEIIGLPITPYLVPQDCQMHMKTNQLTIFRNSTLNNADHSTQEFKIVIQQVQMPFNFSCLPYTAEELENATHIEELPSPRRTVLCIYGPVRGVGGIDSWGSNVNKQYHIYSNKDYNFKFKIRCND